ncbi:MAG: twin-arginine translocase TatA/TatE family subunit [Myxococcota bacterium]|nr:twin-arginine translocase TatA/TatE family subunit [Myxococcota bacterium]
MFGLGIGEFVLVLVVALIVLGPKQLPKVARQLGRATREFKRAAREFQNTLSEVDLDKEVEEYKSRVADLQKDVEKTLQEPDKSPIPTSEDEPFNLELPDGVVSQEDPIDSLPPVTSDAVSKSEEKN